MCLALILTFQVEAKSKRQKIKLSTAGKIYIPKVIKPFKLVHTQKYDKKELGVACEYKAEEIPVKYDYYIYPVDENVSVEYVMMREYGNVIYGIKYYAQQDDGLFSILDSKIITINKQRVITTIAQIESSENIYLSELYLTVVNNHFIKLRATFPLSANKEYDLRDKTRDLFEGLLKDTQFKSKDKSKTVINLDADSSEVQLDVMYGIAVKAMMTKDLIVDFKQFVSVYDNMVKITKELVQQGKMKTVGDKEILSLVEIDEAGFLNEVIWLGYHQDYWQKPSDLKIDDFKQWMKSQNITEVSLRPKGVEVLIKR
jgi:hypothetical protein